MSIAPTLTPAPSLWRTTNIALVSFGMVCMQAVFLMPYIVLAPGERTNLFTAALPLIPMFILWRGVMRPDALSQWLPLGLLGVGMVCVSLFSTEPVSSLMRAFAFWTPTVAGLYCARNLLDRTERLRWVLHFFLLCFALVVGLYFAMGCPQNYLGLHHHVLTGMLLLLSAGPLYVFFSGSRRTRIWVGLLLGTGYVLCLVAGSRFLALLPLIMIPLLVLRRWLKPSRAIPLGMIALVLAGVFFLLNPDKVLRFENYESTFYRLEGIPASWEIIRQRPLTGIGIHAARVGLLQDYEPHFGMASKGYFLGVVERIVTADNQYLSLPVGIGFPLAFLYFAVVGRLLLRFSQRISRREWNTPTQWALLIPVLATIVHLTVYDGLFYPQVCLLFHTLLGAGAWSEGTSDTR